MINLKIINELFLLLQNTSISWKLTESDNSVNFCKTYQKIISFDTLFFEKISIDNKIKKLPTVRHKEIFSYLNELKSIIGDNGEFGKISFWKIENGGYIGPHKDIFHYHSLINRYLLNLTMKNDMCDFLINQSKIPLQPGFLISFDHTFEHSIMNNQNEDVYFLVFDTFKQL